MGLVTNMQSSKGTTIANQFEVSTPEGIMFQSYDSNIVLKRLTDTGVEIVLDEKFWDYSRTTGKYRNLFLGESKKETEAKIKSGVYKLENLNN